MRVTDDLASSLAALDELPHAAIVLRPIRADGGAIVDLAYAWANRCAGAPAGLQPEQMVGQRILEALPSFPPVLFDSFCAAIEHGTPSRHEIDYGDIFGDEAPFRGRFAISASRLGENVLVIYDDLAERERVRVLESRLGAVLEATSDWVSIADADGQLVYVNPAGRRMVGLAADEDVGGTPIEAFSPDWARRLVRDDGLAVARRDGVWRGDLAREHRDGGEIPVSQVIVARSAADGELDFYAAIARDMTRERAAEAALRESEARFRVAFEQAPIGISLLDLDGNFVQVNDAYCRTVRRTREQLLQTTPMAITHPDDHAVTRSAMHLLRADQVPVFRFEKRYLDPDRGDPIWVEISASAFRDSAGRVQYLIGMVQDLGERRVAHTLQRSMLTTQLPEVDGVELAVRYLPGTRDTEVSGDWYDVIALPDGRVGVVIGDVVGRGIEAAATMSQLRTALRAYAIEGLEPAMIVAKLHRLVAHLGVGLSTTLALLDLDPFTRELRYVSAGHLPVLLVGADGGSRFLPGARSWPLGTAALDAAIPQERIVLDPGDLILLYTDGLVERRDMTLDSRLEQLRTAVATAPDELGPCLEHVTGTLTGDDATRNDDIAVLALRAIAPVTAPLDRSIATTAVDLGGLRRDLRAWLAAAGAGAQECDDVLIAVGEACANAIEHSGTAHGRSVQVRGQLVGGEVVVDVVDQGTWRPAIATADRGHGLRFMRMLMDDVAITTSRDGTRVRLRLALTSAAGAGGAEQAATAHGPRPATLTHDRAHGVPVAALAGEVDLERVTQLGEVLTTIVEAGDRGLVLDISAVDYLDSAGLHMLHDTARRLLSRGQRLRVVAEPGAPVLRVLELVDFAHTVGLDPSVRSAVATLV